MAQNIDIKWSLFVHFTKTVFLIHFTIVKEFVAETNSTIQLSYVKK